MWWMDLEPYPGPDAGMTFTEAIEQLGKAYQRFFHTLNDFPTNQFFLGIEHLDPGPTHIWRVPLPDIKPNLNKNGPRRGPAYDRRGRRRW